MYIKVSWWYKIFLWYRLILCLNANMRMRFFAEWTRARHRGNLGPGHDIEAWLVVSSSSLSLISHSSLAHFNLYLAREQVARWGGGGGSFAASHIIAKAPERELYTYYIGTNPYSTRDAATRRVTDLSDVTSIPPAYLSHKAYPIDALCYMQAWFCAPSNIYIFLLICYCLIQQINL
jgi:hypothetical protein